MHFRLRILWLFAIALLAIGSASFIRDRQERHALRFAQLAEQSQAILQRRILELNAVMLQLEPALSKSWMTERILASKLNSIKIPTGSRYYLFDDGVIHFWSDNKTQLDSTIVTQLKSGEINFISNGWYYVLLRKYHTRILVGIIPIQQQYVLQNKYLVNSFNSELSLPDDTKLIIKAATGTWAITDNQNHYLFSLSFSPDLNTIPSSSAVPILYCIGVFLLLLLALDMLIHFGKSKSKLGFLLLLILLVIRYVMVRYHFPSAIYESDLFSPKYYASSFSLNSLGDLLLTASMFCLFVIFLYNYYNNQELKIKSTSTGKWSLMVVGIFMSTFLFSVLINYLLSGLIINSQISFNIANVFELDGYSLVGMLVIGILLLTLYLMCDSGVQFIRKTNFGFSHISILFLLSQGIFLTTLLLLRDTELFSAYGVSAFLLTNSLILFISYIRGTDRRLFSFSRTILVILGFSIYAAQIIYSFNITKEREKREIYAAKLENEQDIVAEYLFEDIETRIQADPTLQNFFKISPQTIISNPSLLDELNQKLVRQYFHGYLSRYEISLKYFTNNDIPINKVGDPSWNIDEIDKNIKEIARPTYSHNFYFVPNSSGRISYLGKINIEEGNKLMGKIIIELNSRFTREENGFPELLLSNKVVSQRNVSNYSYARYQQGNLISQNGNYNYYLTEAPYEEYFRGLNGMRFTTFENHSHLFYRFGKSGLIIVSMPSQGMLVFITLFSYIFTCFSLLFLIIYLFVRWIRSGFHLEVNFKSRIQLTVVSIVVATLVLIGASTVTYIYNNYVQAQNTHIKEKINNVLVLVQNELNNRNNLGKLLSDDLVYSFSQLSSTLAVDFNIYSITGMLLYSSQSKIYEQELIAPLINREAFQRLTTNQKALFIQTENIGKLSYIAAYEPIRNSENKIIGYLNLPYFARETELKHDISTFLVALINIYVLLFSVAILLAFIISNRITEPLRIIQQSIKRTKLGTVNEPIKWKQKDEIGALINEYNRMLLELQNSAELLAKSERESAWREMAKQVAHEIKNPLTPMKLGVQHLQRAWMDDRPNKDEMLQRICTTLIEQIDTLSNIATEFSNFAKMPKPEYTSVDLSSILERTVDLYNQTEKVEIVFPKLGDTLYVTADKDQLLRIFSNLFKNAVQAIPQNKEGKINIDVTSEINHYKIAIQDNGDGISNDQIDKIFDPNFTTKTGGTGLGLAMVKNMLEAMGGSISFVTEAGIGTTFFVVLLKNNK